MKRIKTLVICLITLSSILMSFNSNAQYHNPNNYKWKRLLYYTAANSFDAVGDALNDTGVKGWGHISEAASLGVLFIVPFDKDMRIHFKRAHIKDLLIDGIIFVGVRYIVFNYVYNAVAGLPLNYYGDTDYFDRISKGYGNFGKVVMISFVIPLSFQN